MEILCDMHEDTCEELTKVLLFEYFKNSAKNGLTL